MKVRITKCCDAHICSCWYHSLSGAIFEVTEYNSMYYRLISDKTLYVQRDNCEVVGESLKDLAMRVAEMIGEANNKAMDKDFLRLTEKYIKETVNSEIKQPELSKLADLFKAMPPKEYTRLYNEANPPKVIKCKECNDTGEVALPCGYMPCPKCSKKKPRVPDGNTPVDTLVLAYESKKSLKGSL
jgi:Zn finger protein HypA/HybF involved in hydrogenase expression